MPVCMTAILRAHLLSGFTCLGDKCEDTCCQTWSMQMDEATLARYRKDAPELMQAVEQEKDGAWIMRKDPASGFCVKLEGGMCGIHKKYGDKFLGDACYFYPRVTRALGERVLMTATMSCPEIARLALSDDKSCTMETAEAERLPQSLKNYLPAGVSIDDALIIHNAFLEATQDAQASAEKIFLRIASASRSLERIEKSSWPAMAAFYLSNADARIPLPEVNDPDPFNLLHALCGLIVASHKPPSPRLKQTITDMERALEVMLDWQQVQIQTGDKSLAAYRRLRLLWQEKAAALYAPALKRWLQMQMSMALYPYAGLGNTLEDRITIIGVRLATVKLALMCHFGLYGQGAEADIVRIVQSLSRFLDHLGDPDFSLSIYKETGWVKETRMRGLMEA